MDLIDRITRFVRRQNQAILLRQGLCCFRIITMSIPSMSLPESFRLYLEKAIRSDDNADWTPHTIDYGAFKLLLKGMARRRATLRKLIRESADGRLPHVILHQMLAESLVHPANNNSNSFIHETNDVGRKPSSVVLLAPSTAGGHSANVFPQGDFSRLTTRGNVIRLDFTAVGHQRSRSVVSLPDIREQVPESKTPPVSQYHGLDSASSDVESTQAGARGVGTASDTVALGYKRRSKRTTMRKVSSHERSEMISFLLWEMDKVHMFYLSQWQNLSVKLEALTGQQHQQTSASWIEEATQKFSSGSDTEAALLGEEILELFSFCVINIVTVCQILIRYDAYARMFEGTPMLDYFMKQVVKHPTSFRKILHHEELIALADSFQLLLVGPSRGETTRTKQSDFDIDPIPKELATTEFEAQREMFVSILNSTYSVQSVSVTEKTEVADSFIKTFRSWIEFGTYEDQLGLEPAFLTMRGKCLTGEMRHLAEWRNRKINQHSAVLPTSKPKKAELSGTQVFNLTLNLISACLYCMNYYIVEPSSTLYVNRLGAHDAMSGTLIGMMPLAAFVSSIPYSMWTNYSFRYPLIMSCSLLLMGNVVYSLADQVRSVELALLGRFLAGLGAPKCIIRRYMADTTPLSLRTSVNALFGMVVAAGSAMGPAMAVLLNKFETNMVLPVLGSVAFNGLTMPGYLMAALWTTFLVIVVLTFEEPNRDGLEEQKRLEQQRLEALHKEEELLRSTLDEPEQTLEQQVGKKNGKDVAPPQENIDIQTIFSEDTFQSLTNTGDSAQNVDQNKNSLLGSKKPSSLLSVVGRVVRLYKQVINFCDLVTLPVRVCLGLLFAKVFTIEALVSATSALSKNRYGWQVQQVGTLGFLNGCLALPFSILIGRLSLAYQDQHLMRYLVSIGCFGLFLLIDISDLVGTPTGGYNRDHPLSVGPKRYIAGYFLSYLSIQAFEGVIGSTLSKVIPTTLASGTFNSGLLATLVDTLGRSCGDMFISFVGFISLRQLMNLLFIPCFSIMMTCLFVIEHFRDLLAV